MILPLQSAPRVDLCNSRDFPKLGLDHPIVDCPEFFDGVFTGLGPDDVVKYLTETCRDRTELWPSDIVWKLNSREPLGDVLPRVDDPDVIIERRYDLRETEL